MSRLAMTANLPHGRGLLSGQKRKLALLLVLASGSATAASFTVDTVVDERDANAGDGTCATGSGACSLRAAVEEANALPGADFVSLPAGTYLLTLGSGDDKAERGDLDITDPLRINGSGQAFTIVDGNAADRVFDVHEDASLEMSALTVRNGNINKEGGGIRAAARLFLTDVILSANVGKDGGAVTVRKSGNTASFTNVVFRDNVGDKGGALHAKDNTVVTIVDATFRDNYASKDGGGAYFDKSVVRVSGASFFGNQAEKGGGLFIKGGATDVALTNVTLSDNAASKEGGGLHKEGNGATRLTNATVYANSSPQGAGLRGKDGTLSLSNTIVANNVQAADCDGTITSLGNNLGSDGSCQLSQPGDLSNTDPLVGALQGNGGPTWTHALTDLSPARDAGRNAACPATDQRGVARPIDGNGGGVAICDIGAYEAGPLFPDYFLDKSVTTLSDPHFGMADPKSVPGAVMQYTISLRNGGPGAADQDTIVIVDALSADSSLVVADFDAGNPGPIAFVDGTPTSGLSYTFLGLDDAGDDVAFSDDGGVSYAYTPVPGADGTDANVTHVRITPKGVARYTGANPIAQFLLKVVVR